MFQLPVDELCELLQLFRAVFARSSPAMVKYRDNSKSGLSYEYEQFWHDMEKCHGENGR